MEEWRDGVMDMSSSNHSSRLFGLFRLPTLQHSITPFLRSSSGVTLVELLVVIVIIATIAGILTPVIIRALERADIAKAQQEMATIVSAIQAYFREYGYMPVGDTNGHPDHTYVGKWGNLNDDPLRQSRIMNILRGVDATYNPRRIVFLEIPESSSTGVASIRTIDSEAMRTYTLSEVFFLDPWSNPYLIVVDSDFDNTIGGFARDGGTIQGALGAPIAAMIRSLSPTGNGSFPGVRVGVMSAGPNPGSTNSFMMSWAL
ncbi:MAG: hypothetical protein BWY59_00234 [Verrucomicrobia bacterium ADurb.Bin345]|nr:MAG: hypothetical protein BWY59_00234 [Verrucomicrobia bacterium ADurb.Bin345]